MPVILPPIFDWYRTRNEGAERLAPAGIYGSEMTLKVKLTTFTMTAGVLAPLDLELMVDATVDAPQLLGKGYEEAIDDRCFAEAVYRAALASGLMELVGYQDAIAESG